MELEKTYSKIEEKLDSNICDLLKKENMSKEDLTILGMAVDILKDVSTVKAMDEYGDREDERSDVSIANRRHMDHAYSQGYADGVSMARMRSPRTGRFVSGDMHEGWRDTSGGYYDMPRVSYENSTDMRDGNRSTHSIDDRMVDRMEQMYDNAATEHERARIDKVIHFIRSMDV